MIQTIPIRDGVFINRDSVVSFEIHPFEKREPSIRLDYGDGELIPGKVIGKSFKLSITTTDHKTHKLDEHYSAVAHEILTGTLGTDEN